MLVRVGFSLFSLPFQFPLEPSHAHTHILLRFLIPKSRELTGIAWFFPDLYIFSSTLFCSILFFSFLFVPLLSDSWGSLTCICKISGISDRNLSGRGLLV